MMSWNLAPFFPLGFYYRKSPKFSDTQNVCCNHAIIQTKMSFHRKNCPKCSDGMANSVDPDQTAPLGAFWSESALFAKTCLSQNLGALPVLSDIFCFWLPEALFLLHLLSMC